MDRRREGVVACLEGVEVWMWDLVMEESTRPSVEIGAF